MDIIHLSDLHFGNPAPLFNERELSESLSRYIIEKTNNPIIVISGDITFQGKADGYRLASLFVDNLISIGGVERNNLCFCPGNHDIVNDGFNDFDIFSYSSRRDHEISFSKKHHNIIAIQDFLFIVFNSSFNLNYKYGLIHDDSFNIDLTPYNDRKKVLVFHHHILNQFDGDISAIRNSYELVRFIENNGITLALHGHQHTEQHYHIGKSATPVISARSANYAQHGYLNAFNHYRINDAEIIIENFAFERSGKTITIRKLVG